LAAQPVFTSGAAPSPDALRAAQGQMMADPSLQFAFSKAQAPPPPTTTQLPGWLAAIVRWFGDVISFIAPFFGWIFVGGLVLAVAAVLFFIFREAITARWPKLKPKPKAAPKAPEWRPEAAAARALLEEADRLAAAGDYGGAVRLILHRSIEEIEGRRPRLVRPAFTSREIGRLDDLPTAARATFVSIAQVVERSFFGGRQVDAAGFAECRRTYEAFAFPGAWA
jgi:hypothetical protein